MGLKILWQSVLPKDISWLTKEANVLWEGLLRHAKMVARPDSEIILGNLEKNLKEFTTTFFSTVNSVFLVEKIIQAEKEGFDAVVVGCNGDSGVKEARSAVDIPVVGLTESSVTLAKMYGFKSAVVTIRDTWVQPIESRIYSYEAREGLIDCKPVRYFDMIYDELINCFKGEKNELIGKFEEVARECIKDGADVIINGCALTGPAFSLAGYNEVPGTGVPIIDCTAVGIKFAEIMVDLRRNLGMMKSRSKTSIFRTPEKGKLDEFRSLIGKIS
jgi:allantoin racemase